MGFVPSTEAKKPTFLKAMFYGVAGCGKSTFALSSAGNKALIDFDGGVHRVNYQHQFGMSILQPSDWDEVINSLRDINAMRQFNVIIVDTIDKMMDFIIMKVCGNRQPSIKDWGSINAQFTEFCRLIDNIGINVIFLSHETTTQEKDSRGRDVFKYRPSLREKNFVHIQNSLDILGFVQRIEDGGRVVRNITLNSTICECKQPSGMPDNIIIPEVLDKNGNSISENNAFNELVFKPYCALKVRESEALNAYAHVITQIRMDVAAISDAKSATEFITKVQTYQHVGNSLIEARNLLCQKAAALGLSFDKTTNAYVSAA